MGRAQSRLKAPFARASGPDTSWRHALWPSRKVESFVVSFPKSGRTWLRVMMAVAEAHARGAEAAAVVTEWLRNEAPRLGGSRVLFTHALSANELERPAAMELFLGYIGDRRRLFLVRDPRDVLVSYYFEVTRRHDGFLEGGDLGSFVRDPRFGIDRLLAYLRAVDRSLRDDSGPALLVSYEDLHRDTAGSLRFVLEFFGREPAADALAAAVEFGSFENMQRLELERAHAEVNTRLVPADPSDPESFKTRRGFVGAYRQYFSEADLAFVEERMAAGMPSGLGHLEPGAAPSSPGRPVVGVRP